MTPIQGDFAVIRASLQDIESQLSEVSAKMMELQIAHRIKWPTTDYRFVHARADLAQCRLSVRDTLSALRNSRPER